ncbi:MAG: UDP-N-acetylmuramoyl-tripeptide--D-alanyl-D-alanine ligase [Bacteroidota bacterium]|nr:UDP-N-acetylmuramoyl-tripeptide--D-alanyl-D-alanine ligase [Bacteroidota bacterium]
MIAQLHTRFLESSGISTDSRSITEGSIFFALKGDQFDGNRFVGETIEKGALLAVISDPMQEIPGKTVLVEDTLKTLQDLARYHREQLSIPVIGLTGSNGKTTTKELLSQVLKEKFHVLFTQGNLNNHIGVPLTLLSITPKHEIAVIEMGANHQGEIAELCGICQPDMGLITNFGKAHLEGFGGIEGVKKGKSELYDHLRKRNGRVFVNSDDPDMLDRTQNMDRTTYGTQGTPDLRYSVIEGERAGIEWEGHQAISKLTGTYNCTNMAAAVAIGRYFEIPSEKIVHALESYAPSNARSEVRETGKNVLILDAYNANPSSVEVSLKNLERISHPRKVAILGDMFELGSHSAEEHQHMVDLLRTMDLMDVVLIGQAYTSTEHPASFRVFASTDMALEELQKHPIQNCLVLLKGSRGMKLERLLDTL